MSDQPYPADRLRRAGATSDELDSLERAFDLRDSAQQHAELDRIASLDDATLREHLEATRKTARSSIERQAEPSIAADAQMPDDTEKSRRKS